MPVALWEADGKPKDNFPSSSTSAFPYVASAVLMSYTRCCECVVTRAGSCEAHDKQHHQQLPCTCSMEAGLPQNKASSWVFQCTTQQTSCQPMGHMPLADLAGRALPAFRTRQSKAARATEPAQCRLRTHSSCASTSLLCTLFLFPVVCYMSN